MDQPDAVLDVFFLRDVEGFHQFNRAQAEFGVFAAGGRPAARSGADQLDAQADVGPDVQLLRDPDDGFQLRQPLDHNKDFFAQFLAHQCQPDERLVLVAVADQQGLRVVHDGEDGVQFRLGTGFQADIVRAAEFDDLLHHLPLLVDFNGINAVIGSNVIVLPRCDLKSLCQFCDTGFENI